MCATGCCWERSINVQFLKILEEGPSLPRLFQAGLVSVPVVKARGYLDK